MECICGTKNEGIAEKHKKNNQKKGGRKKKRREEKGCRCE
jgi:hypothetical protein